MTSALTWRTRDHLPALAVCVVALLAFANAIGNEFVYDDLPLVAWNQRIRSLDSSWITTSYFGGQGGVNACYRPLVIVSFGLNYQISGLAPWSYSLLNLLLHAGASVLALFVARAAGARQRVALAAALLFALHPLHTEAVTWISGRAELLAACFGLAALLAHRRARSAPDAGSWRWRLGAAALFALAIGAKESALTLLGVFVAWDLILAPARPGRRLALDYALPLGAVLVYFLVRWAVLGPHVFSPGPMPPLDNPLVPPHLSLLDNAYGATPAQRVLSAAANLLEALRLLVFPARLSIDYSYAQLPVRPGLDVQAALGLAVVAGTVAGAVGLRRRAPPVACGLAFLGLTFSITSNLFFPIGIAFAERLLYLPSFGFVLALAAAAERLAPRRLAFALLLVALVAATYRVRARNRDFASRETLWTAALAASPRSARVYLKLGALLHDRGEEGWSRDRAQALADIARAVELLERSLSIYPEYHTVNLRAGDARMRLGQPARALPHYERAIRLAPRDGDTRVKAALALLLLDRPREALERVDAASRMTPPPPRAKWLRPRILQRLGSEQQD